MWYDIGAAGRAAIFCLSRIVPRMFSTLINIIAYRGEEIKDKMIYGLRRVIYSASAKQNVIYR